MIYDDIQRLKRLDPEIGGAIEQEYDREENGLELIASAPSCGPTERSSTCLSENGI